MPRNTPVPQSSALVCHLSVHIHTSKLINLRLCISLTVGSGPPAARHLQVMMLTGTQSFSPKITASFNTERESKPCWELLSNGAFWRCAGQSSTNTAALCHSLTLLPWQPLHQLELVVMSQERLEKMMICCSLLLIKLSMWLPLLLLQ